MHNNDFKALINCTANNFEELLSSIQKTRYRNKNNILHEIILVIARFKRRVDFSMYLKYFAIFLSKYNHLMKEENLHGTNVINFLAYHISNLNKKREFYYQNKIKLFSEILVICCIVGKIEMTALMQSLNDKHDNTYLPKYNFLKALNVLAKEDCSYMNLIIIYVWQNAPNHCKNNDRLNNFSNTWYKKDIKHLAEISFLPAKLSRTFNLKKHLVNLQCVYSKDNIDIIDNLLSHTLKLYNDFLIFNTTAKDLQYSLKALNQIGVNFNFRDQEGYTPLMIAIEYNDANALKYLIELGASLNKQNNYGQTELMLSVELGNIDALKALILLGVDVDIKDKNGKYALSNAIDQENLEMVKELLLAGAKLSSHYFHILYPIASKEILQIIQEKYVEKINDKLLFSENFDMIKRGKYCFFSMLKKNKTQPDQSRFTSFFEMKNPAETSKQIDMQDIKESSSNSISM